MNILKIAKKGFIAFSNDFNFLALKGKFIKNKFVAKIYMNHIKFLESHSMSTARAYLKYICRASVGW